MKSVLRSYCNGTSTVVELRGRMVLIGSAQENDIVVNDRSVHDAAAKIDPHGDAYLLESIQKEKVRLNGKKTKVSPLSPGDRIEVGTHVIIYDVINDAESGKSASLDPFFTALHKFTEHIGAERDLEKLLTRLIQLLLGVLNGSDAFIFKLDAEGKPQVFVTTSGGTSNDRFSDTVVRTVLKSNKGVCIANALCDPTFSHSQSVADLKLVSVACAPITSGGVTIGIIYIGSNNPGISYSESDLAMLSVYASISGMLINHVDYIGRQNKAIIKLTGGGAENGFIADSKAMREVVAAVHALAGSEISVLIEGPTGSGKNHVADLIHKKSRRAAGPFLVVNCSSLRGELLESELFGHKKGSFTGAFDDHAGLFAATRGGTLVLDEIGELDMPIQAKLLRVLESGLARPIGGLKETPVDVRVICATNRNLSEMVKAGSFRADLYYRINQFSIKVPPLADRGEDIELLAYFFLEKYRARYPNRDIADFHPETLRFIKHFDWPGNIRELANMIHRAVLSSEGPLLKWSFSTSAEDPAFDFERATERFQKELIAKAIKRAGGNKEEAAKLLGLSRSTFFRYQATLGH
jgi:transcriptional regulator with GAF, ATPase, and Fis domain